MSQSLKAKLVQALEKIPGVTHQPWPERDDGFSTILYAGKEIGHFHHFAELDLKLGKKLIASEDLKHPPDSVKHPKRSPNSAFVELPFNKASDLPRISRLVEKLVKELGG